MRIGFIGLGMMGHHMVANLQKAGHDLVVFDVRREAGQEALSRGARWAGKSGAATCSRHHKPGWLV